MKPIIKAGAMALALTGFLFAGCSTPSDPAAQWLLALAAPENNDGSIPTTGTEESTTTDEETSAEFNLDTAVSVGDEDFIFSTTRDITVNMDVYNATDAASGAVVRIYEPTNTSNRAMFTAVVDELGNVEGSFTIDPDTNLVVVEVTYDGQTVRREVAITNVFVINGSVSFMATIGEAPPEVVVVDSDGDGISDEMDEYPLDASRASTVRHPAEGHYTIAYEDLYPKPGDMDFNDYVVWASFEEDLNARGKVVRIRAEYTHVAKGAGYHHTLHFGVPGGGSYSFDLKRYDYQDGSEWTGENYVVAEEIAGTRASGESFQVMVKSNTTLPASNSSNRGGNFKIGKKAAFEVVFDEPLSVRPGVPYDTYIKVLNTKEEIHFAGIEKLPNGNDKFLDTNGFPWAIMLPVEFHWPFERGDMHEAYPLFDDWYTSEGTQYTDWYLSPVEDLVFPY